MLIVASVSRARAPRHRRREQLSRHTSRQSYPALQPIPAARPRVTLCFVLANSLYYNKVALERNLEFWIQLEVRRSEEIELEVQAGKSRVQPKEGGRRRFRCFWTSGRHPLLSILPSFCATAHCIQSRRLSEIV